MALGRLEIVRREPYAGGRAFGDAGAYERIDAVAHYEVDPGHPANAPIVDLGRAERDDDGRVRFRGDATFLVPVDPGRANRALLFEAPNRGNRLAMRSFNMAPFDPHADRRDPRGGTVSCSNGGGASPGADGNGTFRTPRCASGCAPPPCRPRTGSRTDGCSYASSPTGRPTPSPSPIITSARSATTRRSRRSTPRTRRPSSGCVSTCPTRRCASRGTAGRSPGGRGTRRFPAREASRSRAASRRAGSTTSSIPRPSARWSAQGSSRCATSRRGRGGAPTRPPPAASTT